MTHYAILIVATFAASLLCGAVCIPLIAKFCHKRHIYDSKDNRKIHKGNIPRLGGVCFMPSMLLALVLAITVFNANFAVEKQISLSLWSIIFFISLALIYCCGIADDLVGLSPTVKFAAQVIAASLLPYSGLYINTLYGFFGIYDIPFAIGAPLTVFVMVFINNAFNLIDGIDGLSSGLSLIALGGFLVCFSINSMPIYCMLIAGLMGVIMAFVYFNLFGSEHRGTKVFMGDSGSLTIGFIIGFLLVKLSMERDDRPMPMQMEKLLIASSLIAIPILDTLRIIVVRLAHGRSPFAADKNHIHHKLLRTGLGQHGTLLAILAMALAFLGVNILLSQAVPFTVVSIIDVVLWIAANVVINNRIRQRGLKVYES